MTPFDFFYLGLIALEEAQAYPTGPCSRRVRPVTAFDLGVVVLSSVMCTVGLWAKATTPYRDAYSLSKPCHWFKSGYVWQFFQKFKKKTFFFFFFPCVGIWRLASGKSCPVRTLDQYPDPNSLCGCMMLCK